MSRQEKWISGEPSGQTWAAGINGVGSPRFSSDGTAYAYVYSRTLSNAYVVTGLK
jgi:hypothetical protein